MKRVPTRVLQVAASRPWLAVVQNPTLAQSASLLIAAFLLAITARQAMAQPATTILYVDADAGGAGDGTSWADAYVWLQDALDQANTAAGPAVEIWMATGIYYPDVDADGDHVPGSRAESFVVARDGLRIYGGFDPSAGVTAFDQRDPDAYPVVLSGDVDRDDLNADGNGIAETWSDVQGANAYHVLVLDGRGDHALTGATVIDGLVLTAGQATGVAPDDRGGGIYCRGGRTDPATADEGACSPVLTRLVVSGHQAHDGAGIYNEATHGAESSPQLQAVTIAGNRATHWGGGVYNHAFMSGISSPLLQAVTVRDNQADWGAGMASAATHSGISSPVVRDTTFEDNHAAGLYGAGGGMYNYGDLAGTSSPLLTGVTFRHNSAGSGGGMHSHGYSGTSSSVLIDVLFERNQASTGGGLTIVSSHGGQAEAMLLGVRFHGNVAQYHGGGLANTAGGGTARATLVNVLLAGNQAGGDGGGLVNEASPASANLTLINVTLAGNVAGGSGGGLGNLRLPGALSGVEALLTNAILWGNQAAAGAQIHDPAGTPLVSTSLVEGGFSGGSGIIVADPLFVRAPHPGADGAWGTADDDYGDLRLRQASPAIDEGDDSALPADTYDLDGDGNTAEPTPLDLGGGPRFVGAVDVGAYETDITAQPRHHVFLPLAVRR